jgi:putative transposase
LIDRHETRISIARQCELLTISRSSVYYRPAPTKVEDAELKNQIDEIYTEMPFYGSRKISKALSQKNGIKINRKRVQRLMREMGIQAIHPGPKTTIPNVEHKKFPYLLRNLAITHAHQVWSTDITYIPLKQGFAYLVAIIDWHSKYVLSWRLSNTMDASFCIEALEEALNNHGKPEFFNSDQGSQFTCEEFVGKLIDQDIRVSMDGRGRCHDNIFVERLWRSVKYENVYPKAYETIEEAREGLQEYFELYNNRRLHQSLGYKTPISVHYGLAA